MDRFTEVVNRASRELSRRPINLMELPTSTSGLAAAKDQVARSRGAYLSIRQNWTRYKVFCFVFFTIISLSLYRIHSTEMMSKGAFLVCLIISCVITVVLLFLGKGLLDEVRDALHSYTTDEGRYALDTTIRESHDRHAEVVLLYKALKQDLKRLESLTSSGYPAPADDDEARDLESNMSALCRQIGRYWSQYYEEEL